MTARLYIRQPQQSAAVNPGASKVKRTHRGGLALFAFLVLLPSIASANAGVPMIFLFMPALAIAIVPVVIIEAIWLSRSLELAASHAARTVTLSNLASTLVGIPLTWLGLVAFQVATGGGYAYGLETLFGKVLAVTWQAPWLIPYETALDWMIPAASLFLLIPFFFVSWWSESLVTRKLLKDRDAVIISRAVRDANILTYCLLALWPAWMLAYTNG